MQDQVCTLSPALASRAPFLPGPPPPLAVRLCACGEPLTLEMELDMDRCVDCLSRERILQRDVRRRS